MLKAESEVSVVIPTLNEEAQLEQVFRAILGPGLERIVVDGGSTDRTRALAERLGADCVLRALPGRARQLQAGYLAANAEWILFLHADTVLEDGWRGAMREAMRDPAVAGGAFRFGFQPRLWRYRWIEWGAELRCRWGGLPYGDQAIFVRRKVLDELGGVPDVPIFEDLDLAVGIRAAGRLALLRPHAWTSSRRYDRNGVFRTWLRNTAALFAFLWGVDRDRVARWYRGRPSK